MRFFAGVVHLELSSGDDCHLGHIERGWVDHHRRVHTGERAAFQEENFAATAFFCRGADHADGETDVVAT